jgi:hypothetical protein
MSLAKNLKHLPGEKWMALGGTIGEADKTAFLVGDSARHIMETEGEITCFANDAKRFFWNEPELTMFPAPPLRSPTCPI